MASENNEFENETDVSIALDMPVSTGKCMLESDRHTFTKDSVAGSLELSKINGPIHNLNNRPIASLESSRSSSNLCSMNNGDRVTCCLEGPSPECVGLPSPIHQAYNKIANTELISINPDEVWESNICKNDIDSFNGEPNELKSLDIGLGQDLIEEGSTIVDVLTFDNQSDVDIHIPVSIKTPSDKPLSLEVNKALPMLEKCVDIRATIMPAPDMLSSIEDIQSHPAYRNLVQQLESCREQVVTLTETLNQLNQENEQVKLDARSSQEACEAQLEILDKRISQQQSDLLKITELNQHQAEISSRNYSHMKSDLESQLDKMTKMYDSANKDREMCVMRYAVSEKEVIDLKKERESMEKRLKDMIKDKDVLVGKLKSLTGEKERVGQMLDVKCHELLKVQKENEKFKDDLNSREIKIKWIQNKLCTELDMHKETQSKLEKFVKKVQDTKEESEQVHRDCQTMMRAFQTSEENRAFTLDQQLKEQQAALIMERHERQDKEETLRQLLQEVDSLKGKHQVIINENNALSIKVQNLEKERLEYEQNLSKLKRTTDEQRQDVVDLRSQLAEMESIRIQLQHEQEKLSASHTEVERLRLSNAELQQDMAACREREAELLDFTQKLTDKNVRLQSEFSATEAKAQQLECEIGPQMKHISELEAKVTSLSQQLDHERQQRLEENQLLARHLAEKTQRADSLAQQLEDQEGENQVLKRKQAATVKELLRELVQVRKRAEISETLSANSSLGHSSRASSSTSLNTVEPSVNQSCAVKLGVMPTEMTSNGCDHLSSTIEPDRQLLIERIVKLQRASARKTEKLEFMEEHTHQLVAELQKKSRVVQSYIMREQAGALSSDLMDRNKAEVTRHGGIMASVYGSKAVDDNMTLELSLEINRKLQAVLEDTLLKNITLKESIDTLGAEISRLQRKSSEKT